MRIAISVLFIAFLFSCKTNTKQQTPKMTNIKVESHHSTNDNNLDLANITLKIPEGWKQEQPDSKMRVAQLFIEKLPEYKIAVFFFGEQDMINENIERWKGQYSELESFEELPVNNKAIKAVKLEGTFKKKDFPMAPDYTETPGYGTLAAIVPSDMGPYYLKISAPQDIINGHSQKFIALLNSYSTE